MLHAAYFNITNMKLLTLFILLISTVLFSSSALAQSSTIAHEANTTGFNHEDFLMSPEPSMEQDVSEEEDVQYDDVQEPETELEVDDRQDGVDNDDNHESFKQDQITDETEEEEFVDDGDLEDATEKLEQLDIEHMLEIEEQSDLSLNSTSQHWSMKVKSNKKKPIKKFWAWITLSTKSSAYIYQNKRFVGAVRHWAHVRTFKFRVQRHDTIGVISKGTHNYHGIVAAITVHFPRGRRLYVTGRSRLFKAISASKATRSDRQLWRTRSFKTCHWKTPVSVKPQRGKCFAKKFPLKKLRAKYVWARGGRKVKGGKVYLRFKVGGDRCKTSPRPKPGSPPKRCACRPVKTQITGQCYEFTNPKMLNTFNREGRCKKRDCTPSYECVSSGRKTKTLCVRRFATSEVRIVGRVFKRACKNVRVRPAKPFYVPYEN